MTTRTVAALIVGLTTFVLAACGGGSGSSSGSAGTAPTGVPTSFVSVKGLTDDAVRDYLVSLAFSSGATVSTVLKWQKPIPVFLYGASTADDRATVEAIMAELRTLTGLSMAFAPSEARRI